MFFNSIDFAVFLPFVFFIHWFAGKNSRKKQNAIILFASYVFYGWWDYRFLGLIIISSFVDFFMAKLIYKTSDLKKKKSFLIFSLCINLGFLGFFKYFNFFTESFVKAFSLFGCFYSFSGLDIILPVGISFYTFQTMSYSIDVYKNKIKPTNDIIGFFAFVSFFPQLVAGPIERASNLLPQFSRIRKFDYDSAVNGMRQILWGLVKKILIADNCAVFVNLFFDHPQTYSGSALVLGVFFFSFQIYCDFSGYSDIAIGTARLFGFNLMKNFNFPYFSKDVSEFWRRWHISLTTWFRDYIYLPLGGSRNGFKKTILNVFIVFLISGLWHGANFTFIFWGLLNAFFFLPYIFVKKKKNKKSPEIKELLNIFTTFSIISFTWIFFRAKSIGLGFNYIFHILKPSLFSIPVFQGRKDAFILILIIFIFIIIEWKGRNDEYAIEKIGLEYNRGFRWVFYAVLISVSAFYMPVIKSPFIYFQF